MHEIKIKYSKDALKFLSKLDKKSVLAWDPDYTKVTAEEAKTDRSCGKQRLCGCR